MPVAFDAGDAYDLARTHLEIEAPKTTTAKVFELQDRLPNHRLRFLQAEEDRSADHHLGEPGLRGLGGRRLADDLASAQDRDAIGDLEDLVELVADEHDRLAGLTEPAQVREQRARLGRREHRRWLVQDQDIDTPVQRLQDLDSLLLTDRELLHLRGRIDLEPICVCQLGDTPVRLVGMQELAALLSEDHVLRHGEGIHQDEVLVDHPDPVGDGVARGVDTHLPPPNLDRTAIGGIDTVEDAHQRRLASPVLTDERVHLARPELEGDIVVRHDAGEAFRQAPYHDEGRGTHPPRPSSPLVREAAIVRHPSDCSAARCRRSGSSPCTCSPC